jgi:hypothetical protein
MPNYETTTTTQTPWGVQQPYLDFQYGQAKANYESGGPQYYPENTVAGFSPMQEQALGGIQQRAGQGSPVTQAGQDMLTQTLQGNFLNSNPYIDQMYQQAQSNARSPIDSQFSGGGRYGSAAGHQSVMQDKNNQLATNIYGQNYANERAHQMNALNYGTQYANQDYTDLNAMYGAGQQVQNQGQNVIDANVNRYNYNQNLPEQNLNQYANNISGNPGQTSSTTSPLYGNSGIQNAISGGMAGYGLGQNSPWLNPWLGAGLGALGGGILG